MKDLVSIIIPTFNGLPWLDQSIQSALSQTHKNCEVIIIDDGSSDGTKLFIENNYSDNVKYHFQNNKGLASARNLGLAYANGEYIQFLDSDDILPANKIENHYKFLRKNQSIDVVYCHCKTFINNDDNVLKDWDRKHLYSNGNIFLKLVESSFILPHMPLSRKKIIEMVGGYDIQLNNCLDYDFWLRVASLDANFYFLDDDMYVSYRIRKGSLSSSSIGFASNGIYVLKKLEKKIKSLGNSANNIYNKAIGGWIFKRGRSFHENGNYARGIIEMIKGIISDRSNFKYKFSILIMSLFFSMKTNELILKKMKFYKTKLTNISSF